MTAVSGHLVVGEANVAQSDVVRRQTPSQLVPFLAMIAVIGGGVVLSGELGLRTFGSNSFLGWLAFFVGAILSGVLGTTLYQKMWLASFKKRFKELNGGLELPLRVVVEEDQLVIATGGLQSLIAWDAIGELFEAKGYWFVHVHGLMYVIPRRCLGSADDERQFISAIVSRMSAAAVARSEAARQLAA